MLELYEVEFENLIGLEDFTSLKTLNLYYCFIIEDFLDLSIATTLENFYLHGNLDAPDTLLTSIDFTNNPNLKSLHFQDDWMIRQINLRGSDQYITGLSIIYDPYWYRGLSSSNIVTLENQSKLCVIVTDPDAVRNRQGNYATWAWSSSRIYFTTDCTLSITDFDDSDFKVYPNPSKEHFQIETTEVIVSIELFDLQGKKIKSYGVNQQNHSVADLSAGLYFLKFKLKSGEHFMKKLMVD